jgi:iron complex outermembrane receptor protein
VWSPASWLNAGVDLFRIKISDILATPSAQEVVSRFRAGDPACRPGGPERQRHRPGENRAGEHRQRHRAGADLFVTSRHNVGNGRLDVALNGTYMDKFDQMSPGGVMSHKVGTLVDAKGTA